MDAPAPPPPAAPRPGLRPGVRLSERVAFPEELPITAKVVDIANAIDAHPVIIVAGETGSGKTTQLPKICLAMGRGDGRHIGCTQPRRIAATSVATRVAQELDSPLGELVGYKVRFNDKVRHSSAIKFLTDGMLLAEIEGDPLLRRYDTLIIDEAHERSLNIDFLLGFIRQLLPRRPDLRVIISSATLETARFSAFFGGAPVLEVSGRTYPVDVLYRPPREDEEDLADAVANTVNEIAELDPRGGDVLVFLPGEREIREAVGELEKRALPHTVLLPLYARLPASEQQRVFARIPQRRVVLATNVAETSLTIPGIIYVVDAGVARVNRYNVRTGVSQLLVEPVSRASADQRKGRCGRTASGVCFRLYEEQDYLGRPAHTDPEIKRVGLAGVILRMKALALGDIERFPFLDPPQPRAISEGYRVLEELGAIDEAGRLTPLGAQLGRLPTDPRLGRMILGGKDEGALREVVVIAAALGLQDPRERPQAAAQKADEAHRKFRDEGSDFVGYLKLWAFWQDARRTRSRGAMHRVARDSFLSYTRMREWEDIHDQLVGVIKELGFAPNAAPASGDQIHRALLPGLLSKVGVWNPEARDYVGARHIRFKLHPSSGLAKKPPAWVMAAELVETSQLFARTVAKIDPGWIEAAAGALCKRSHGDPHWEQKPAQVMAKEQVTLFGLPIVKDRRVPFATHDPALCRDMFITHALVRHEYATKGAFMAHNQRLLDEVHQLRARARQSDMLADEYELAAFFDRRLPPEVVSGKTFEDWRRVAEARDPRILFMSLADILLDEAAVLSPERFPPALVVGGVTLPLTYRFEPGADDDGATATVPLAVLPQLEPAVMAWTIPGWHEAKLRLLLEGLPKATRRGLGVIDELARVLATELRPFSGPLGPTLAQAVYVRTGERVAPDAWDLRALPPHLALWFRVVDDKDKVLGEGRDLAELQRTLGARARQLWAAAPRASYERAGLQAWDFDALPAQVTVEVGGRKVQAYPALVETETAVDLRLLESAPAALEATRGGVRRLCLKHLRTTPAQLEAQLPAQLGQGALASAVAPALPRRELAARAVDEAFGLTDAAALPRTRKDFEARLAEGKRALPTVLAQTARLGLELATELDKVRAALRPLQGKPGAPRAVVDDVQAQLAHLTPPDLLRAMPAARLAHVVRYLKAIQVRLQRQANDPMKDAQKAAAVAPLWTAFRARRTQLAAQGRVDPDVEDVGWLIEELRVQTFAPELKTAIPLSAQLLADMRAKLK